MTALVGGLVALFIGIITLIFWWGQFLMVLAGTIPVVLLLGGALATYLGMEEIKDKERETEEKLKTTASPELEEKLESYKEEVQGLKEEIAKLKGKDEKEGTA